MPAITFYDVVVPVFIKALKTFDHVLAKAEQHAKETGIDADVEYTGARLIEDQLPLTFQVQNAVKNIVNTVIRITGTEVPQPANTEKTFAELHARIQHTLEILEKVDPTIVNAREDTEIEM